MSNADHRTGFDHAVILVHDLESAAAAFERLGFRLSERHAHATGTANHTITFENEYIELLTVTEAGPANQQLVHMLSGGDGLRMLSLKTGDVAALMATLQSKGVACFGPFELGRTTKLRRGGEGEANFKVTVPQPPASLLEANLFFTEHLNPEIIYEPGNPPHPNGAVAVRSISSPVDSLAPVEAHMTALFGADGFVAATDAVELQAGSVRLRHVVREAWPHGAASGCIEIASANLSVTRGWLTERGVAFEDAGGSIAIDHATGGGVRLVFIDG